MQDLLASLAQLVDTRRKQGTRHSQAVILFLFILATLQGCLGRRSVANFVSENRAIFYKLLDLKKPRLPSASTIERTLKRVDSGALGSLLSSWEQKYLDSASLILIAADAQTLKSTVVHPHSSEQNFISVCSFFSILLGTVVQVKTYENKQKSEILVLQEMIKESSFGRILLLADALHTQKNFSPL